MINFYAHIVFTFSLILKTVSGPESHENFSHVDFRIYVT